MSDPGLTNRLRQHSRRSGFMVGITMLLTIVICIGASTTIYARLSPLLSDFVSAKPRATPTRPPSTRVPAVAAALPTPPAHAAAPTPTPVPTVAAPPSATPIPFKADYRVRSTIPVNFRSVPSSAQSDTVIAVLPPSTPLQYLNVQDDSSGTPWMKFRTQDGHVGWIRQIDVEPLNAGQ